MEAFEMKEINKETLDKGLLKYRMEIDSQDIVKVLTELEKRHYYWMSKIPVKAIRDSAGLKTLLGGIVNSKLRMVIGKKYMYVYHNEEEESSKKLIDIQDIVNGILEQV